MPGKGSPIFDEVKVIDEDVTEELEELLAAMKIDPNDLTEEASSHSATFARLAVLAEEASSHARFLKKKLDLQGAELDSKVRRGIEDAGEKVTEAKVDRDIATSDEIIDIKDALDKAERAAGILAALRQSLIHRKDMIMELMRDHRHDWEGASRSV